MTTTARPFITAQHAPNVETTAYTASGVRACIDKFTATNGSASTTTLAVKLVPSGGSAGASNLLITKTLTAGESYTFPEIVGHWLEAGGFISLLAGAAAAVVVRASGREVS